MIDTLPRTELVKTITACRSCGSGTLDEVLDLGTHAVSDFYDVVPADELRAPLCLVQCGGCGLVQLTHSVSRDRLYKDYWYRSGLNPAMVAALADVVADVMNRVDLHTYKCVLDIGSNDGTLLDQYPDYLYGYGVEPSDVGIGSGRPNPRTHRGHEIIRDFYPPRTVAWNHKGTFKAISSIAMFYDLDDPNAFVKAIKEDLHPEGIWVNQMMDLEGMIGANAFDNICHEHVGYWRIEDFYHIVRAHGLQVECFSHNAVNGGSVRLIVKHGDDPYRYAENSYHNALRAFTRRLPTLKDQCLDFLQAAKANGKTVLGYGASTKGNTLLQYYGIDPDLLPAIAERNPDKVGKLTAGSHIPIISEAEMRERKPDYLLVLPWSQPFLDGFLERERDLIAQGTRLVAPLPTLRVLGG